MTQKYNNTRGAKYNKNVLCRLTNTQYINNIVCIVKYSYMFRCIDIIFRESLLIYDKVTKSIKLIGQNVYIGDWITYVNFIVNFIDFVTLVDVNTSKHVEVFYDADIIVNILCIRWSK